MENTALRIATSALCAAALAVSANATTVNDGDTIAWFSLDEDFVPIDGPADIYVAECVEAGVSSYSFNSYADPHPILDASGNVVRQSKYVTMDKSRVYIQLSKLGLGSDVTNVTFEAFFRGDGRGSDNEVAAWDEVIWLDTINGWPWGQDKYPAGSGSRVFYLQNAGDSEGKAYLRVGANSGGVSDYTTPWFDGVWHHVAVTIDGTAVTIYKDYAFFRSLTLGTGWSWNSGLVLAIGSRSGGSTLDFDEIRITKGVLAPTQFLCFDTKPSDPQNGDTMLYFPFDGDLDSLAFNAYNEFGPAQTGIPTYDADVWKASVVEYGNHDAVVRKENTAVLKSDKNVVTKTIRNPHLTTNAFNSATIEFFMKGSSNAADLPEWAECVQFDKTWMNNGTRYAFLVQVGGNQKYYLRTDTDQVNSAVTLPVSMTDGKWHHFAITVEPTDGGTKTLFKYYADYGDPVTVTKDGLWVGFRGNTTMTFGSSNTVFQLDEFRITKGVLPKAKFLKAQALGATVLTIR